MGGVQTITLTITANTLSDLFGFLGFTQMNTRLDALVAISQQIKLNTETIMVDEQQTLALLATIDQNTTQAATVITQAAGIVTTINTNVDALLAKAVAAGTIPQSVADAINTEVGKTSAVTSTLTALSDALTALASKSAGATPANPVPVPIPPVPTV